MSSDLDLIDGTPTFHGTKVPMRALFRYLAAGSSLADFLKDFPSVSREMAVRCVDDAERLFLSHAADKSAEPQEARAEAPGRGRNLLRLLELHGVGKETFAALGGGEEFIRSERRAFAEDIEK